MKVQILLLYYERPKMVMNALDSILKANDNHKDWQLAIIDDSSKQPIEPIARDVLKDHLDKISFLHTNNVRNMIGRYMNQASLDSDADIGIMLCDDDALCPSYLKDLSNFYSNNPNINAAYCKLSIYSPAWQKYYESYTNKTPYNKHKQPMNPARKLDSSQVSWRIELFRQKGLLFPVGITKNLDAAFYHNLNNIDVQAYPMGTFGQYKGQHPARLFNHDLNEVWAGKQIDIEAAKIMGGVEYVFKIIDRIYGSGSTKIALRICKEAVDTFPDDESLRDKYNWLISMIEQN